MNHLNYVIHDKSILIKNEKWQINNNYNNELRIKNNNNIFTNNVLNEKLLFKIINKIFLILFHLIFY